MTLLENLKSLHERLTALRKTVGNETAKTITKKPIRTEAEQIGTYWFSGLADELVAVTPLNESLIQTYSDNFANAQC